MDSVLPKEGNRLFLTKIFEHILAGILRGYCLYYLQSDALQNTTI